MDLLAAEDSIGHEQSIVIKMSLHHHINCIVGLLTPKNQSDYTSAIYVIKKNSESLQISTIPVTSLGHNWEEKHSRDVWSI